MTWAVDLFAFRDHRLIWYVADGSLVSFAKFRWVVV